jgi:hypothetical protein
MHLIPDGGSTEAQVRIVGQNRLSTLSEGSMHGPSVRDAISNVRSKDFINFDMLRKKKKKEKKSTRYSLPIGSWS